MKDLIKNFKLNENTISTILGGVVVLFVGYLIVNYLRSTGSQPSIPVPTANTVSEQEISLPTTHTVEAGETLWSISEKYFKSGFNWVDIAAANNLSDAGVIKTGMELTIPNVSARLADSTLSTTAPEATPVSQTATPSATSTATISPSPTVTATSTPTAIATATPTQTPTATPSTISAPEKGDEQAGGDLASATTYTVSRGDNLWKIAERAYGDGSRWVEIATANNLKNPRIIHSGNNLSIPR